MPILAGRARVNSTSGAVVDLTDSGNNSRTGKSQVKGMGLFSSTASRDAVNSSLRVRGYMAVVSSGGQSVPYIYTSANPSNAEWTDSSNWSSFSASNGIPAGGLEHEVLAKTSDADYAADWTGDPIFNSITAKESAPVIDFKSNSTDPTGDGTVLGVLGSHGVSSNGGGLAAKGARIQFKQSGASGADFVPASVEFYTSSGTEGQQLALTLNEEKTFIFAGHAAAPTAYVGGMYYNSETDSYYVGVNE